MTKKSVVAQSAPQKPYHPSPVQDSKRCGFGGLLSRPAVHAASRDEEDSSSSEMEPMAREGVVLVRLSERSDLPFIGAREGGERAATEGETKRRRRNEQPAAEGLHRSHSNSTIAKLFSFRVTFRIPVVRGKNLDIGSAHSRGAAHRDEAWHGEAGGGGGGARGCPSCSHAHTSGEGASLIKRSNSL